MNPSRRKAWLVTIVALGMAFFTATAFGRAFSWRVHSIAPAEGYRWTKAVWIYFEYPMSVPCALSNRCITQSEWVYAYVSCRTGGVAVMQEITMNANGNVVAVSTSDVPRFVRGYDRHGRMPGTAGQVFYCVCGNVSQPD